MKKTLLITGGAGYIGSHAVVAFEQAGYRTVIIDNFCNSSKKTLSAIADILGYRVNFFEGDILDVDFLESVFSRYNFDGVLHFSGLKAVGESCEKPFWYHENNTVWSLNLLKIMQKFGVKNILFSSSATVYDAKNPPPFTENMATATTNPYGTTKLVVEKMLEDLAKHQSWKVTVLRYFNPVGAHFSGKIGEEPKGIPNNLLPFLFDVALKRRDMAVIFGDDYPTIDGTGVRDYIHIDDLISAHILAYESQKRGFEVYNVGTGKGASVLEMIRLVEKITEQKIPYRVDSRRFGDIAEAVASPKKIQEELGWVAKKSLYDAIKSGWDFCKKSKNG